MSTYTDLHNRIKENLTILRKPGSKDDGMSPQKVILVNPENQFYGTFNGKMNITSGVLSGLKIVDSELEGVKLDDASVDGMSLRELKTTVDVNTQDIEQLQKDAKTISAAHDALSVGLSGAVDNLSVAVNEKLDNAVEEVKKSVGGVVGDVSILSDDLSTLSGKVESLSTNMLNGVVYRGQLNLHRDRYDLPRQLFNDDPACCLLEGTQAKLLNGWMFKVRLDRSNVSSDYVEVHDPNTNTSCYIGEGDYLIIKNHNPELYDVIPSNQMRLDDFDIINAQDEDDTKIYVFKQISAFLNSKIETLSSDLSGDIDDLSTALSGEIDSLSARLSNLISSLSSDLCAEIELDHKTIKEVSAETLMSANAYTDQNIAQLSDTASSLVSATSADTLAQAKAYTEVYADRRIDELSATTDSRLSSLSNDLSSYSNKLCSDLSTQVDAEYVHRAGDAIAELSVTGQLSVSGKTTLENEVSINAKNHSALEVLEGGISAKTDGSVAISANEKIELKSKAPIDAAGSRFTGVFTNGVQISSTSGLDDFAVNGKTIQSTLVELSAELTGWTHAQDLELSNEVDRKRDALSTSLSATVDNIAANLSTYSQQLCSEVSTQVNNEFVHLSGDKISWIDAENLSATDAKIKQLDAVNIASRQLSVDSTNDIVLKSGNSIILSTASGIHTNVGLEKVVLAGTSLQTTMHNVSSYLDTKKLDVELANQLSTKICSDVVGSGYLKAISVDFRYDAHDKLIKLSAGNSVYQISADDFIKDGMLQDVKYDAVGDDTHPNPPYIVLSFNTDAGKDDIWLRVNDLVDIYKSSEDGITLSDNIFSLKYNDIKEKTGLNALSNDLYGVLGDPRAVGRLEDLQNQIDAISVDNFGVITFTGHLVPDLNVTTSYSSVGAFLQSTRGEDHHEETLKVKNGASFNIYFKEKDLNNPKMISVDNAGSTLLLGNGDVLVVHDHSNSEYIELSNLLVATDENPISGGNVYILKAGTSRYEFEAEVAKRIENDNFISSWIERNFANSGIESYASTTTLNQAVSADGNLSVANDAFVLNDLSVARSLFVNGAQLGITTKEDPGTGEYKTVAETTADEISFVASDVDFSSESKTAINLTKNFITFQNAAVDIDAKSSFILSADKTKVIDATSSKVEILSVLTVSSDQARITTLSSGELSSDTLTSRVADISEKLSATSAYIDWLSASEAKVANSLSVKSFSNLVAEDTISSIADLCVGLSVGIQNLSTNLSTNISTLTSQIQLALSALDKDPLSSLNKNSKISAVIDAVLDIRDTLGALRSILRI